MANCVPASAAAQHQNKNQIFGQIRLDITLQTYSTRLRFYLFWLFF
jgi:hypothetical protein